jgi:outer membrane protein TolC
MTAPCHGRDRVAAALVLASLAIPQGGTAQSLTLAEALDAALGTHPALVAADARVLAAEGAGDAARATRLPVAVLSASLTQFQEPMVVAPLHSLNLANPPVFDRTLMQGQAGARYTLFDGGARASRIRGTDALHDGTRAVRSSTEMHVLEETVSAYLAALAARTMLEAARAQAAALEEERARAQRHFEVGGAAELEVLRAEAVFQEARAEEASALARAGLAERGLARLMGVAPQDIAGRALMDVALRAGPARGGARRSPLVEQADRSVAAAEARLAEERAARLPTVDAGVGVLDFGTASGDHVLEWRAGLEISWPVFTGGGRSAAVRRAASEVVVARGELDAAHLQVAQEIDAAETAVVEADARLEALEAAVAQWEEVARIEALALAAGSGEQRDLLGAEAGLFQARAGHALARQDALLARVRVARAEGFLSRTWINEWMENRR